jgi:hypothetical protein
LISVIDHALSVGLRCAGVILFRLLLNPVGVTQRKGALEYYDITIGHHAHSSQFATVC